MGEAMKINQDIYLRTNLEFLIKRNGLTITRLAGLAGLPKQTLHNWLCGAVPRNLSQIKKLASLFNLSVDEFCFGSLREQEQKNLENLSKHRMQLSDEQYFGGKNE